jgi:HEAT repeat protein
MRSSPELDAAIDHAHRHGRDGFVARWREHEIRSPSEHDDQAERAAFARALSAARTRVATAATGVPAAATATPATAHADLLRAVATGTIDEARKALTALARAPDPAVVALLHEHLGHAQPRMRLHAHRLLRGCEARDAYLAATMRLVDDPIDDVRRTAIRTLGFARFAPAAAALVDHLLDPSAVVRRAAEEALLYLGDASRGPLRRALAAARPDRRAVYERIIDQLDRADPPTGTDA